VLEIAAMKALLCTRYGGPDDLEVSDIPAPTAYTGQAVVRV
jgi:NADPH2:quinone reductase